jgi:hypothetical protein
MRCHKPGCNEPAVWQSASKKIKVYCIMHLPAKKGKFIRIKPKDDQQELFPK